MAKEVNPKGEFLNPRRNLTIEEVGVCVWIIRLKGRESEGVLGSLIPSKGPLIPIEKKSESVRRRMFH